MVQGKKTVRECLKNPSKRMLSIKTTDRLHADQNTIFHQSDCGFDQNTDVVDECN
jgi:hypothetical protein